MFQNIPIKSSFMKRYLENKTWVLTFLLIPIAAFLPTARLSSSDLMPTNLLLPAASSAELKEIEDREEKISDILATFKTGLPPKDKDRLASFIIQESLRYGFEPELIMALISTESSFYNWSSSPKGAVGLMQIIPATGEELAEITKIAWRPDAQPLFDPFVNVRLGIHYLSMLHHQFKDIGLALTAYNYGPGNVARWIAEGKEIPTKYSEKVLNYYSGFLDLDASRRPPKEAPASVPPASESTLRF